MGRKSTTGVPGLQKIDGRYYFDLRFPGGRHKKRFPPGTSLAAAKLYALGKLEARLAGKLVKGARDAPRGLRAALDAYLKWVKGAGAGEYVDPDRAHADKTLHVNAWLDVVGDVPLGTLGRGTFEQFKADRKEELVRRAREKGKTGEELTYAGNATVNRALTTMGHFVGLAARWGWIPKGRAAEIRDELVPLKEPPGRVRWLRDDERQRLYAVLPPELEAVVLADVHSGLRLSNVLKLRKDAVDLKHRTLTIVRTKSGERLDLPINDDLAAILDAAMKRSKTDYVFVNRTGQPYTRNGVSSFFIKKCQEAGVKKFSYHSLRHDFATSLRRNRVPLENVSALLGHGTLQMSMRYAHVGREALHEAVATLNTSATAGPDLPPGGKRRRKK